MQDISGANRDTERQLDALDTLAGRFGQSMSTAFARNIAAGKDFDSVLKSLRQSLAQFAVRTALAPLQTGLTQAFQGLLGGTADGTAVAGSGKGLAGLLGFAAGGVIAGGRAVPFASGGVVAAPTYFPLGRQLGLMGEQGAEAILPLARGPDGRLGVRAGGGSRPVTISVTIATADADSFRRSEAQVSAALARAVARGQRAL